MNKLFHFNFKDCEKCEDILKMIINKSPLVLREILVLIVLFGYSVNGNEKLATQCANQGEPVSDAFIFIKLLE